jgi:hypothetical protein
VQQVADNECHETNGYESHQSKHHISIDMHEGAATFAAAASKGGSAVYVNTAFHDPKLR